MIDLSTQLYPQLSILTHSLYPLSVRGINLLVFFPITPFSPSNGVCILVVLDIFTTVSGHERTSGFAHLRAAHLRAGLFLGLLRPPIREAT